MDRSFLFWPWTPTCLELDQLLAPGGWSDRFQTQISEKHPRLMTGQGDMAAFSFQSVIFLTVGGSGAVTEGCKVGIDNCRTIQDKAAFAVMLMRMQRKSNRKHINRTVPKLLTPFCLQRCDGDDPYEMYAPALAHQHRSWPQSNQLKQQNTDFMLKYSRRWQEVARPSP